MPRSPLPLALLGAGLLLAGQAQAQSWRTVTSARQLFEKKPLDVEVQYGAGELTLAPAERPLLYRMEMRYDEDVMEPVTEYDARRGLLKLGTRGREGRKRGINFKDGSRATITLSREVPLDLHLQFGAGEASLNLGGLALRRLDVSTGASETRIRFDQPNTIPAERVSIEAGAAELEVIGLANTRAARIDFQGGVGATTLDFTGRWNHNATASIQMGVGSVVLRFPRGLGVQLNKSSFLTSFDSPGMVKRGNSFYSSNWEKAAHRLTLDVDAAFGSIEVEWVGN